MDSGDIKSLKLCYFNSYKIMTLVCSYIDINWSLRYIPILRSYVIKFLIILLAS